MNWELLAPEIVVAVTAFVLLVLDFTVLSNNRKGLAAVGLIGIIISLIITVRLIGTTGSFGELFLVDTLAIFFKIVFLITAILIFLISLSYLEKVPGRRGEFYWLILTALLGMMVTAAGAELITIYIGIELISLSFYGLVGFRRDDKESTEAALKYFVLGTFAIGLWLYGAAIIYGITGHTNLTLIAQTFDNASPIFFAGLVMLIAGFGFKMGLAPFHLWVPDAYQGAPTPATAFLAVGSKAAAFAVFLRVMFTSFGALAENWAILLGVLAAITMAWGNIAALRQTNIKRLLAYSGIAHAGYILVGVVSANVIGSQAVMFYLLGYLFANVGAFAVVIAFSNRVGSELIADYAGLRWRNPFLALCMALCLLSLAGIPPLAGFFGKFYLFLAAIQQGGWLMALVVFGGINSAISLFYYVNVIKTMYFIEPKVKAMLPSSAAVNVTLVVAVAGVILAAFYFQPVISGIEASQFIPGALLGLK